ncbi:hypothetical protein BDW59DRAFT_144089 [Aspergillus cavernicola]|uniref:Nucleotidyl transferase AbiEii/AbiGii toxin family protein n=1 Tax=Aspergillus cavernicola TaxID=176166 RepID=A0ABR4IJ75_9EURO
MSPAHTHFHTPAEIRSAAAAVGAALAEFLSYAIIGGGAYVMLGNARTTEDIDFVVPRSETAAARRLLRASADFVVEPRTNRTTFRARDLDVPVDIEILAPPAMFKEPFDQTTEVITVGGVKILKLALILNAKWRSWLDRPSVLKKNLDLIDICFLLKYCAQYPKHLPRVAEVPTQPKNSSNFLFKLTTTKTTGVVLGTTSI